MTVKDIHPGHVLFRDSLISHVTVVENQYANNLNIYFQNQELASALMIVFPHYSIFVYQEQPL